MPTIDIISIINTFATAITALATWKAFRMAYKAYRQSHELKRITSFDSLFAQLMSNQLSLFGNNLSKTRVNNRFEAWLSDIKKDEDVFTNFFHFFDHNTGRFSSMHPISPCRLNEHIWQRFQRQIKDFENFNRCFKYLYHEIQTILLQKDLCKSKKMEYTKIIQCSMNDSQLFSYLINQIIFFHMEHSNRGQEYIDWLKESGFFDDMYKKEEYRTVINRLGPSLCRKYISDSVYSRYN